MLTHDEVAGVRFPYFANTASNGFATTDHPDVLVRNVPVKRLQLKDGETLVASVYDLFLANYGVDQGFGGDHMPSSYDDVEPYSPAWAEAMYRKGVSYAYFDEKAPNATHWMLEVCPAWTTSSGRASSAARTGHRTCHPDLSTIVVAGGPGRPGNPHWTS